METFDDEYDNMLVNAVDSFEDYSHIDLNTIETPEIFEVPSVPVLKIISKEIKILICEDRSNGHSIEEICRRYGTTKSVVLKTIRRNLALPVQGERYSHVEEWIQNFERIKKSKNRWMSLERLNLSFPKLFKECWLERIRELRRPTTKFLKKISKETKVLICEAACNRVSIQEICDRFAITKIMVLKIIIFTHSAQ